MRAPRFGSREELEHHQLARLRELIARLASNRFYAQRLKTAGIDAGLAGLDTFRERTPFTTKSELARDQENHPPYGSNLTRPPEDYVRIHQTSSTTGEPLRWLDTKKSWDAVKEGWRQVFDAADLTPGDRVLVAFSFGPFIGLWLAFEAAQDLGARAISGGALSSEQRLRVLLENEVTVLCCTPTYALRLGEVARETGLDLSRSKLRAIIVGGEPGGSVPATRDRIQELLGARVHDHYGMTEVGPVSYVCPLLPDVVHCAESLLLCEVIDRESGEPIVADGERTGELVLTTLERADSPVLRYRTGDIVRPLPHAICACGRVELGLRGGILARADEMIVVRGVNLYPSAVDAVVRRFDDVAEYRIEIRSERGMSELELELEPVGTCASEPEREALRQGVADAFRSTYSLRVPVRLAATGSLPRFDLKARRWIRIQAPEASA